jgi:hypothetical protein
VKEDPGKANHEETRRRPPSRRLVRHVLRARVEATNALAGFFDSLSRAKWEKKVGASGHLGRAYGGVADGRGWRHAGEVRGFLEKRGAAIPTLGQGPMEDEWGASSEGE